MSEIVFSGRVFKVVKDGNWEIVVYPGAGHGFHADYRPSYNKAAADDAWTRCTGWFSKHLRA